MAASHRRSPCDLPIAQLVLHASSELRKLGYSRRTLRRYGTVLKHLCGEQNRTLLDWLQSQ